MKTVEYTIYPTKKGNFRRVITDNGIELKRHSETRIEMALTMSGRIYTAITNLDEGETLTITCKLKENGDN